MCPASRRAAKRPISAPAVVPQKLLERSFTTVPQGAVESRLIAANSRVATPLHDRAFLPASKNQGNPKQIAARASSGVLN
jgi:hypothetical protein